MSEKCELWVLTDDGYLRMIFNTYKEAQYVQKNLRDTNDEIFGEW